MEREAKRQRVVQQPLSSLSVKELQSNLKALGLGAKGNKAELLSRYELALAEQHNPFKSLRQFCRAGQVATKQHKQIVEMKRVLIKSKEVSKTNTNRQ